MDIIECLVKCTISLNSYIIYEMKPEHSIIHEFESNISKLKIVGNIFITFYNRNKSTAFIDLIRNTHTHTYIYTHISKFQTWTYTIKCICAHGIVLSHIKRTVTE